MEYVEDDDGQDHQSGIQHAKVGLPRDKITRPALSKLHRAIIISRKNQTVGKDRRSKDDLDVASISDQVGTVEPGATSGPHGVEEEKTEATHGDELHDDACDHSVCTGGWVRGWVGAGCRGSQTTTRALHSDGNEVGRNEDP